MKLDAKEIKSRIDLVEYLRSLGIELEPIAATDEYRGLCPFHADTSPSLQVNRRKGLWHCFGCGAGGDAISFVMKHQRVRFRDALSVLVTASCGDGPSPAGEYADVFCAAADYWAKCLAGSREAKSYLERRQVWSEDVAAQYGIGYAPGGARTRDWLLTKGFEHQEIRDAGLVNRRGLDAFFGRVTFPLVEDGRLVNVYGRSLSDTYRHMFLPARRNVVFNLQRVEGDRAIVTESVIDTLTLAVLGIRDSVSCLSSRLTRHQVDVLASRFRRLDIAFDGDAAGREGALSAAGSLRVSGVVVGIVELPEGSDVNSLVVAGASRLDMERLLSRHTP